MFPIHFQRQRLQGGQGVIRPLSGDFWRLHNYVEKNKSLEFHQAKLFEKEPLSNAPCHPLGFYRCTVAAYYLGLLSLIPRVIWKSHHPTHWNKWAQHSASFLLLWVLYFWKRWCLGYRKKTPATLKHTAALTPVSATDQWKELFISRGECVQTAAGEAEHTPRISGKDR